MARSRSTRWAELLRGLFGLVYVGGGLVHLVFWVSNRETYAEITQFVLVDWYRELWTGLVLPNLGVLLPVLALFELAVAAAILSDGRRVKLGLVLGAGFNVSLMPLGFWWPTNAALVLVHLALLRYDYPETTASIVRNRLGRRTSDRTPNAR